jgi:hypothetical protein
MINYDNNNNNNSRDSSNNDGFTIIFDGNNLKNWRMAGEGKLVILKEAKEEDKRQRNSKQNFFLQILQYRTLYFLLIKVSYVFEKS